MRTTTVVCPFWCVCEVDADRERRHAASNNAFERMRENIYSDGLVRCGAGRCVQQFVNGVSHKTKHGKGID